MSHGHNCLWYRLRFQPSIQLGTLALAAKVSPPTLKTIETEKANIAFESLKSEECELSA